MIPRKLLSIVALCTLPVFSAAGEWSGHLDAEVRWFTQDPFDQRQPESALSLAFAPEYYNEWNEGADSFAFKPFFRWDQRDSERTHFDLREMLWIHAGDGWELRAGVGKVFWGVTEALHLVDVINQTDLVENPDGEQKLGQPLLKLSLEREWGTLDLFMLPGFRERTYPGSHGRLRPQPVVETSDAEYESGAGQRHVDFALRWSRAIGDWDIGLAHFHGTGREPTLLPALKGTKVVLVPYYEIIDQTSLDLQATKDAWLWKLEALRRSGQGRTFAAATGGFEYTLYGIAGGDGDLGILLEYLWDERGSSATTPFQDDLFFGLRWSANDEQSTELLAGIVRDWSSDAALYSIEGSRRLGQAWKISLQARFWSDFPNSDPAYTLSRDDYLELTLQRYF